jgi:hypothetical protein
MAAAAAAAVIIIINAVCSHDFNISPWAKKILDRGCHRLKVQATIPGTNINIPFFTIWGSSRYH